MKKLIAVFLLAILLFNIGGQLAFHQYLSYQSDKLYDQQVAQEKYNVHDLIEVKIPINMPGIDDHGNYENISGRVNFANASYNYVKFKITSTGMYLMCVPNYETTKLSGENVIEAKGIKDIPVEKKEHVPFGKLILIVYNHQDIRYRFATPLIVTFKKIISRVKSNVSASVIDGPGQPPDAAAILS